MDKVIVDRIERQNPEWTVIVTEHAGWFEVEVFDINGLVWRKRSFEPDYSKALAHFINTHC